MAMTPRTKKIIRLALLGVAGGAVIGLAAGCQSGPDRAIHGEMFPADEQVRPVDRMVDVQSAAAARSDATLNDSHFGRGASLNSLGRARLDLMLRDDDDATPLVVYLDVRTAGGATDAHRESVRHYLADRGVADAQLEFRTGPNLEYTHPARDGLRGLRKLEARTDADPEAPPPTALVPMLGEPPKK